jgi:hypothetical protein
MAAAVREQFVPHLPNEQYVLDTVKRLGERCMLLFRIPDVEACARVAAELPRMQLAYDLEMLSMYDQAHLKDDVLMSDFIPRRSEIEEGGL